MNSKSIRLIPLDYDDIERLKELYEDGYGGFWIYDSKKFLNQQNKVYAKIDINKFKMDLDM